MEENTSNYTIKPQQLNSMALEQIPNNGIRTETSEINLYVD